jgi:DNA polymerase-3 subunit chi
MTEIEFHFNVPDKLAYTCRLLRKACRTGVKAVVTAEPGLLTELDQLLWRFSATEFVPHCVAASNGQMLAVTPVLLADQLENCPADRVLINLGQSVPNDFERFERFIEVVSGQENDRLVGRQRWKHYKDRGFALKQNDLSTSRESA